MLSSPAMSHSRIESLPIIRDRNVDPRSVRLMAACTEFPGGYIIVGREVDVQTLLFDAMLTEKDKRFLRSLNIKILQ